MSAIGFFERFDQALAAVTEQRRQERAALEAGLQLAEEVLGEVLKILDGYAVELVGRLDAVTEHSAHTRELSIEERETGGFRKLIYARSEDGRIAVYQLGLIGEELEPEKHLMSMGDPQALSEALVREQVETFLLAVIAERPDLVPAAGASSRPQIEGQADPEDFLELGHYDLAK
ncbi:hypothetical protein BKE38_12585 [Pseudoroseomonas deserti]|uniref:Uncharacterized protein n=1 Tax=Teichococcus deserti TaxID=1817963 RepID=A0A1V2H2E5_9PROT|nr:hypothetical protein [Pseudoroseomonas deserti]ONG53292.1 hypothetical protein BKE38_12585 [Pseudoroseomonas deserti]